MPRVAEPLKSAAYPLATECQLATLRPAVLAASCTYPRHTYHLHDSPQPDTDSLLPNYYNIIHHNHHDGFSPHHQEEVR